MAVLVEISEVKEIMDNCTLDDAVINTFIYSGHLLVDSVLGDDTTIGASLLKEIERWFVAHMLASTLWRTTTQEKIGDAEVRFTGKFGVKLDSTPYGQMVQQLDTTGKMGKSGKLAASIYAIKSFD